MKCRLLQKKLIIFVIIVTLTQQSWAIGSSLYDQYHYSGTYYYGITGHDVLIRIFKGEFHRWPERIQSVELAYTLNQENALRRFVRSLVDIVQFAGNITYRQGRDQHNIIEFSPYFAFRWANFPWNHIITTSLAIGEGISYVSSIPAIELKDNTQTKRLLNYLMFEASFALPQYPRLQFVARIHHRSGAYGLYRAGNSGSNVVGIGLRYLLC